MTLFAQLRSWWNALFHRVRLDNDIEAELQFHLDAYTQQLIESGLSPQEAQRRARIEFGHVDVQKEKYRFAIGLQPLHEMGGDIRYGLRSLYRNRAVSSLYPALYRLERNGALLSEWGDSENNRRAKYYMLSASGRRQLEAETEKWTRIS